MTHGRFRSSTPLLARRGSKTKIIPGYEKSSGAGNEDIGTGQALYPDCAQVNEALKVCGLGPESLRELFDTLQVIGPSEVKAKMEALRSLRAQMDMQDQASLN